MRKHRLHNFILGMLIMALLVALAIPALAMTGQKQMNVDYLDIKLAVDGVPTPMEGTPLVSEGTTYLPVRAVGEALGKEVRWDGPTRTVYIADPTEPNAMTNSSAVYVDKSKKTIEVDYLDIKLVVDGKEVTPRDVNGKVVEPFAYKGTTYLPVRAVGEALGKTVRWDGETKTVHLGELPQGTYLVDVCKALGNMYRAVDGKSFTMSDGKRYSQGFKVLNSIHTFELGGKYESLTFDWEAKQFPRRKDEDKFYLRVHLNGELAQEIEVTEDSGIQTVTVPLNYAQTVSFSGHSNNVYGTPLYSIANAVLNGERAVPEKPVPPANATYLVDVCKVSTAYKAAEGKYFKDIFGNQYTNGIHANLLGAEVTLNGKYKTLKATVVQDSTNSGLEERTWYFSIDGEVVKEIKISNAMPYQTIEIPLNYGMKLSIEKEDLGYWSIDYKDGLFLADAILE